MKAEMVRPAMPRTGMPSVTFARRKADALSMLRSEVDLLVEEDTQLMKIAGAAALFVSQLQGAALPESALNAASTLAKLISEIPDDTMCEALDMLNH